MGADIQAARKFAEQAAREVAARLTEGFGVATLASQKSVNACDVVTAFDMEIDDRLFELLKQFDSSLGFQGEERGHSGSNREFWLVDPIDGTGHYMRGIPFCTTMIALVIDGRVEASVINDFVRGNTYSAARGHGASCDGESIKVSNRALPGAYVGIEIDISMLDNLAIVQRLHSKTVPVATINCGWEFAMTASVKDARRI
jgi:myo-inositol-1(or 4)-monophosphatase